MTDDYPSRDAMMAAVELEIQACLANGHVRTVVIGGIVQKAIDRALAKEPTESQINAAAEVMWNDRDARHGGPWADRDPREIVVVQTKATARAALVAAAKAEPSDA